jgi:lipase
VRLNLHEWGDPAGEPLVCVHGLTGHGARFRRLGERLAGRRVLAPDLRGHGRSSWEPPWATATHAGDVIETLDSLAIRRADWLGFSFGGRIAAAVAARAAERVARACLLDPALSLPPATALERAELEREELTFRSSEEAIEYELASGTLFSTPRELLEEEMREHLARRGDGLLEYRYCRSATVTAFSEMADEPPPVADVPTLLVRGDRSWVPVDGTRYTAALGDRVRIAIVPSGHSVLWDAFERTATEVASFLDSR